MNGKKSPFKRQTSTRSKISGERIWSDVKQVSEKSIQGCTYAVCFVDDCTRRGKSYPMKSKTEVFDKWEQYLNEKILARGKSVRYFRSDNGTEYNAVTAFNNVRGILSEKSPPYCQSMDGVGEVYWRETFKLVRNILWDQQREAKWWAAALGFADHLRNHIMTKSVPDAPPESLWQGKTTDVSHFKVPLCPCWAYIESENREDKSLGQRRMQGVFVGYASNSPCYLVRDDVSGWVYPRRYADV